MADVVDYIGGRHKVTAAQARQRSRAQTEALLEQRRLRKVHPTATVEISLLAFIEPPTVPTKLQAGMGWPYPRFKVGRLALGGVFFVVMGEGDTAEAAVDAALKRHPKPASVI